MPNKQACQQAMQDSTQELWQLWQKHEKYCIKSCYAYVKAEAVSKVAWGEQ